MFEIDDKDAVTRQLRIVSIEELEQLSLQHGWDAHYTQLGASSRPGSYLESRFGSILVTRTAYPGAVSVKSGVPPGYVGISLHLFAAPAKIKGEPTADNRLFVGMPTDRVEQLDRLLRELLALQAAGTPTAEE